MEDAPEVEADLIMRYLIPLEDMMIPMPITTHATNRA